MLDEAALAADALRVGGQIDAVQVVREALVRCVPLAWTGEAGRVATESRDRLVGDVDAALTELRGVQGRLFALSMSAGHVGGVGIRVL